MKSKKMIRIIALQVCCLIFNPLVNHVSAQTTTNVNDVSMGIEYDSSLDAFFVSFSNLGKKAIKIKLGSKDELNCFPNFIHLVPSSTLGIPGDECPRPQYNYKWLLKSGARLKLKANETKEVRLECPCITSQFSEGCITMRLNYFFQPNLSSGLSNKYKRRGYFIGALESNTISVRCDP